MRHSNNSLTKGPASDTLCHAATILAHYVSSGPRGTADLPLLQASTKEGVCASFHPALECQREPQTPEIPSLSDKITSYEWCPPTCPPK